MEPAQKRMKTDGRKMSDEDLEDIRKNNVAFERVIRNKNQEIEDLEDEVKILKAIIKRDGSFRIFISRIATHVPLEDIKEKFSSFGKILDIEVNPRSQMNRSFFITYYDHAAVRSALTAYPLITFNNFPVKVLPWMDMGAAEVGLGVGNPVPSGGVAGGGYVGETRAPGFVAETGATGGVSEVGVVGGIAEAGAAGDNDAENPGPYGGAIGGAGAGAIGGAGAGAIGGAGAGANRH